MAKRRPGGARALWKGVLRIGRARVPVKLYAAVQDRTVHFRLLHDRDRAPVRQELVDPQDGEPVGRDAIRKGVEVERGVFVVVGDEELERLEPATSRDVAVERFVPADALDHRWYERPYWLGPDGDADAYFALAEALGRAGRAGVAQWVMRGTAHTGLLRAQDGRLVLFVVRHADEVVPDDALEPPGGRAPDAKELAMAKELVAALAGRFEPERWHDEYRERVLELVAQKAKGRKIRTRRTAPRRETSALGQALSASLRQARRERARG